ncbi:hypothetical protein E2C01_088149 [Portunus trituberculatus]|uniref:Uncharacterized protein n=1 Tax=Portunus trituberculatus TaxID=210409 RepID=A0A5B7JL58_PORTR|nr:hypothetical protein [Portunus trituberculatus]
MLFCFNHYRVCLHCDVTEGLNKWVPRDREEDVGASHAEIALYRYRTFFPKATRLVPFTHAAPIPPFFDIFRLRPRAKPPVGVRAEPQDSGFV